MQKKLFCMHIIATLITLMSALASTKAPHNGILLTFSILPRSFLANWLEEGAYGEEDGLED